jgi:teichuronic acid biosynthesis glycosyltransferase TuaG
MPLVSVITAAYNAESFIAETINSVVEQTFTDWEYIVVDDGSADDTARIIKMFSQVKYVYQSNQGVAVARNTGLAHSSGKYIAIIDADDIWVREKLAMQIEVMRNHPEVGFCYTNACTINEQGAVIQARRIPVHSPMSYVDALTRAHSIVTSSVLFDRVWLGENPYPSDLPPCEDFFVNLMVMFQAGPGVFVDKPLVHYRERANSLSKHNLYYWALQNEKCVQRFLETAEKIRPISRDLRRRAIGHAQIQKAQMNIKTGGDVRTSFVCLGKALVMNPSDCWLVVRQFVKLFLSLNGRIPLPKIF